MKKAQTAKQSTVPVRVPAYQDPWDMEGSVDPKPTASSFGWFEMICFALLLLVVVGGVSGFLAYIVSHHALGPGDQATVVRDIQLHGADVFSLENQAGVGVIQKRFFGNVNCLIEKGATARVVADAGDGLFVVSGVIHRRDLDGWSNPCPAGWTWMFVVPRDALANPPIDVPGF